MILFKAMGAFPLGNPQNLELLKRAAGLLILRGKPFTTVGDFEGLAVLAPAVPVVSSNVKVVGPYYVGNKMDITFRGGRLYRYSDISMAEYEALLVSPSKGQFVNGRIAYSYAYERLS